MSRSNFIKDLAGGKIDVEIALKRLKVLLIDFDKPEIEEWINCELSGYKETSKIPSYRKFSGQVTASFLMGTINIMRYSDIALPTQNIPDNIRALLEEVVFFESISAVKLLEGERIGKIIPPEFYKYLQEGTNIESIISAKIEIPKTTPREIISAVENRILDILILLEREFGNLDELDLDITNRSPEEIENISNKIEVIVYKDYSVNIGDNNKIVDSVISSGNKNEES